jgi:RES domain-containing protein
MLEGKTPASQQVADRLIERGYAAMIVRSYAHGARHEDLNLVFWHWTKRRPHRVTVFDPSQRLPRDASSWRQ